MDMQTPGHRTVPRSSDVVRMHSETLTQSVGITQPTLIHAEMICTSILRTCIKNVINICIQFSSVQSLSRVRLFATPWTAARQASLSLTTSQSYVSENIKMTTGF